MAFWWVNHKQTRDHEVGGGYLWSPMRNANDGFNKSYENMTRVRPGDVVFSYANGQIGAIGHVTGAASPSPKPSEFGNVGDYWSHQGWLVDVYFSDAPKALRPKDHLPSIAPLLPSIYAPIQQNGNGNQGCYLAEISDTLGYVLLSLLEVEGLPVFQSFASVADAAHDADLLDDIHEVEGDLTISETQRIQLAKARIGQGLFRKKVMIIDPTCRVTGVEDSRLLIASHIKPWRDSSNAERIDGFNGIMLSPHIDALFDGRLIAFENNGQMLLHPSLSIDVLDRWSIPISARVAEFRPEQQAFLAHHRDRFGSQFS